MGHVTLMVPSNCSEEDEDRIELALAARTGQIGEPTLVFSFPGAGGPSLRGPTP